MPTKVEKWQEHGLRIERNCPDPMFRAMAKEIVNLYGWDNSEQDYAFWLKTFGEKFSVLFVLDQDGNPVGTLSLAVHSGVAQIGLFYVREQYRGLQLGHALFREAFERCESQPMFCYGISDMWKKYADVFGMCHLLDWHLWTMSAVDNELLDSGDVNDDVVLMHWSEVPFAELIKFDRVQTAGIDRQAYLREALARPNSASKIALCKESGKVIGICQARELLNRRLGISLFYAHKPIVASALLRAVLLEFAGSEPESRGFTTVFYNTPSTNGAAVGLFRQLVQGRVRDWQELTPQFSQHTIPFPAQYIYSIGDEHTSMI